MKNSFLQQATADLIRRVGLSGLENYTLVFPMQRAGLFVKQYLFDYMRQEGIDTPVVLPHLTTIDMLSDSLSALRSDDEIASVFRLYKAYSAHTHTTMPPDAFYGWGQQLMTDISNVDMALLDVSKMMQMASDACQLETLDLDDEVRERLEKLLREGGRTGSVRAFFEELWAALPMIYRDFRLSEEEAGVGTRGARSRWVIEHWEDERVQQGLGERHYAFLGFNYLLGAERELMRLVRERDEAHTLFYWDYDAHFPLQNGIYDFIPREIARFGNALEGSETSRTSLTSTTSQTSQTSPTSPTSSTSASIEAVVFGSAAGQAQYVHSWLEKHHKPGDKTAIVVADESVLPQVVYSLPTESKWGHINITKGYPLRATRIYAEVVAIMERVLADNAATDSAEMIRTISTRLERVYKQLRQHSDDRWLMVLIDEAYYQAQMVLRSLMVLMAKDAYVAECLEDKRLLVSLIRRKMEMVSVPFHGEPITDIQIIGVLETRLLDFDNVLILNVEEGVVPNTAVDRSFLPLDLRSEYHMQTRDEESKIYGYNFFRLLRRAKHVTLTFSEATTDTGKKCMSRFLMQMLTSPAYHITRGMVSESDQRAVALAEGDARLMEGEAHAEKLSPSAISEYIECPKEYYLKHIRHIYDSDEESVFFSVSTLGTLVHAVLEALYRARREGQEIGLREALTIAYQQTNAKYHHYHPEAEEDPYIMDDHEAENHAILRMAEEVLKSDEGLEEMHNLWLEKKVSMRLEADTEHVLTLEGVVDRLDRVKDETGEYIRVLDYKTGKFDERKMRLRLDDGLEELFTSPDKRYALQTLIYCMMVAAQQDEALHAGVPMHPELFYPRNPSADRRLQLPDAENPRAWVPLTDYRSEIAGAFEPRLRDKVREIITATEFPMVDEKTCTDAHCYCPYHLLCGRVKKNG